MRIDVGADHAGTPLNEVAIAELRRLGHEVVDLGTHDPSRPNDYPDYAAAVAEELTSGRCERGLLICGSGVSRLPPTRFREFARAFATTSIPPTRE